MATAAVSNGDVPPLDRDAAGALHARISDWIRTRIASGEWPSNYRLHTEPELAAEWGVSRGTLRRALSTLIGEGLLKQVKGRGTFVTSTIIEPAIAQKLTTLSEDFASQGFDVATTVLACELIEAPRPVASLLDVAPGQRLLRLRRLRSTERGALALLVNFVRTDLAPGIEQVDFTGNTLFGTLEHRYQLNIAAGRRTFTAEEASPEVSRQLGVDVGSPVQYLEQVTYLADGRPIEYSDVWINSKLLRVTSMLSRR